MKRSAEHLLGPLLALSWNAPSWCSALHLDFQFMELGTRLETTRAFFGQPVCLSAARNVIFHRFRADGAGELLQIVRRLGLF
jgi:hypothetical protein